MPNHQKDPSTKPQHKQEQTAITTRPIAVEFANTASLDDVASKLLNSSTNRALELLQVVSDTSTTSDRNQQKTIIIERISSTLKDAEEENVVLKSQLIAAITAIKELRKELGEARKSAAIHTRDGKVYYQFSGAVKITVLLAGTGLGSIAFIIKTLLSGGAG